MKKYIADLERDHNVICVHQRPHSPESNMLDLCVWMAFQNVVEKQHIGCMKDTNCLAKTVDTAWNDLDPVNLENVWNRWRLVLDLIIDDDGGNRLVESKRGKLFHAPPEEAEVIEDVLDEEETDTDILDAAEVDDSY